MNSEGQRPGAKVPWLEISVAALPAAAHALLFLGRLHPDELYQSLEIAFHKVYGYGIVPWEWQVPGPGATQPWGIRNHAVPLLLAALFRLGDAVGIHSVMGRRTLAEIPLFLLHVAMLGAVWRLVARRLSQTAARWCVWLMALYAPVVWFQGRTMSESFSAAFLVWGLERLDAADDRGASALWGGVLLGFAEVTRYGSAAAIIPAMAWLLVTRRWKHFGLASLGGLGVAVALGWLDWVTWGEWFHSLIHYLRYNVLSGAAAATFGVAPWWAYAPKLMLPPFAVAGLVLLSAQVGKKSLAPGLFLIAGAGYLVAISVTAHKEDRFVYPALVLLTVGAAPAFAHGLQLALTRSKRWKAAGFVIAASQGLFFLIPTPFDVQRKEQFQLTVKASEGATGLVVMNEGLWGAPGFFYLGKNVPWCTCDFPRDGCFQQARRDSRFNRAVYWSNGPAEHLRDEESQRAFEAAGFHLVERRGAASYFEREAVAP